MDHALSMRAPETGSPPTSDWSLFKTSSSALSSGHAQYHVLDAVGVRLGVVSGWVRSPLDQVVGLCVGVRGFFKEQHYLIPIGYVTQVNLRHKVLHLRDLTRRALPQVAVRCDDGILPPAEVLEHVLREAPDPRPELVAALLQPEPGRALGVPSSPPPAPREQPPQETPPSLPSWQSLAELAADDDLPYWL